MQSRREVDRRGQQILNQFRFAWLSSQHDERTQESHREPHRTEPPDELKRAHDQAPGFGSDRCAGAIGNTAASQHQRGEDDEHQKLAEKMNRGAAPLPIARAQEASDDHKPRQKKRVAHHRQNEGV